MSFLSADHSIEIDHQLEETQTISDGLREFNTPYFGGQKSVHFAVYLKDENQKVVGGIIAWMRPGMHLLYIDTVWIPEEFRGYGLGRKLMLAAEAEGKKHGCNHSQVDTLPFQAEAFYKKLGYYRIGVVEKQYGEHDTIFMRKQLTD